MTRTSIIIPAYNSAESVKISIDSALAQTRAPYEIIVIDDGSTDDTADVAERYRPAVRVIRQANAGQGAARNSGLAQASGEFVAFLDADDFWDPEFLAEMEPFLDAHPEAVAASCGIRLRSEDQETYLPPDYEALLAQHPAGFMIDDFFSYWAKADHIRTGTALIRMEAIQAIGFQNPNLRISQDLEYWGLLGTQGPWGYLPRPLWSGTSAIWARRTGWRAKYAIRRKMTPSIETWQERILPRLSDQDMPHFRKIRGRIAAIYALNHVLGGDPATGRQIVRSYQDGMPNGVSIRLLKMGNRLGAPAWWIVCQVLRYRDIRK